MNIKRGIGAIFIFAGLIMGISGSIMTGAVIGFEKINYLSIIGILVFVIGAVLFMSENIEEKTKVKNLFYDKHALDRLKERNLFPTVVENAIETGEHHPLARAFNFGEAKGATDAYISRNSADVAKGKLGERIISLIPGRKREYKNVIVLTDRDKKVKTAYVRTDSELESFLNKYVRNKKDQAA